MEATILADLSPDDPAYRQEFLALSRSFLAAKDEEEAIAIANDSPFGLGEARSAPRTPSGAKELPAELGTGMVFIKLPVRCSTADLPFGGIKEIRLWKGAFRSRNSGVPQ